MGIFDLFGKSGTVYIADCTTAYKYPEIHELYKKIFQRMGIKFSEPEKHLCSGYDAYEAGYENVARKQAKKVQQSLKDQDFRKILTTSPEYFKTFLLDYPNLLPDWDVKIKNIWKIIADRLESKPGLVKYQAMEYATFHDNCYLGRYCDIYDEPRRLLGLIGYEIKEMPDNKENSMCCGSCGGLSRTNPKLADDIAKQRILQAKRMKIKKIIVTSVDNYRLLKKNAENQIEILELSEVLAMALGIKKPKAEKDEEIDGEQAILDAEANRKLSEELAEEDAYEMGLGELRDE